MPTKEELIKKWISSGTIKDSKVIEAFRKIPRGEFIEDSRKEEAYGDYPLPIGEGQTISQPTTVAIMTQALELREGHKVLEVGAGSGYQAAIISQIIGPKGKIISTEIVPELVELAKKNIKKLNLGNIEILKYDGSKGYAKEAPYDRIIVAAASPKIPKPLIDQLKENGIIIIPVGNMLEQAMIKGRKENGKIIEKRLGDFVFVPLKGKYGY
ncbi:protein-L-isoaspartate O-methyltransferase [Candidatus Woesearchaeota archaeon]|nr:protein-L-isoaspartate O-methyltransferase [Candidatus Woesearchaeota archaeon]